MTKVARRANTQSNRQSAPFSRVLAASSGTFLTNWRPRGTPDTVSPTASVSPFRQSRGPGLDRRHSHRIGTSRLQVVFCRFLICNWPARTILAPPRACSSAPRPAGLPEFLPLARRGTRQDFPPELEGPCSKLTELPAPASAFITCLRVACGEAAAPRTRPGDARYVARAACSADYFRSHSSVYARLQQTRSTNASTTCSVSAQEVLTQCTRVNLCRANVLLTHEGFRRGGPASTPVDRGHVEWPTSTTAATNWTIRPGPCQEAPGRFPPEGFK